MILAVLDKKLIRDMGRLWAQGLAIALVMACGVATIIISVGAYRSLDETRAAFYDRYRFGHVFASAVRVPEYLKPEVDAIEGVASAEMRVSKSVLLDIADMVEPASGIVMSIPDFRQPHVNRLYLRAGRLPFSGRVDETAIIETFAKAHGLGPGDTINVLMNGHRHMLKIVGIVLSPEYIYAIGPGDIVPDERRFAVFFMSKKALQGLFDFQGAFNNISLVLLRDADPRRVLDQLEDILRPYGGGGAIERKDQMSHAFLDAELQQLSAMSKVIPPIFLFVAAFLVNMILSRLIALEREQIGLFKALGYSTLSIGGHYAKLVTAIALFGVVLGSIAGLWMGRGLTSLYAQFFSFPFLIFRQSADLYILAGGITVGAALMGAAKSIWAIANLAPAVAMRPPNPTQYRTVLGAYSTNLPFFSQLTTMALRHLWRWPVRSAMTTLGTSMSVALLVTAMFSYDSIESMIDTIFFRADRQDATITFAQDRGIDVVGQVSSLPGVLRVEPFRSTAVKLRNGHRELRLSIVGTQPSSNLSRVLDLHLQPLPMPSQGLVLSQRVAEKLQVLPGERVEIELLDRHNRIVQAPVAKLSSGHTDASLDPQSFSEVARPAVVAVAQSYIGLTAHMDLRALNRILQEGRVISGARLLIDRNRLNDLYAEVKKTPALASIALQKLSYKKFRATIEENISIMNRVYVALAVIMAFGVIYNSARIQLSERARELASLRVFGFSRAEVSRVLLVELGIIVALAQPLGWVFGYGFSWSVLKGFQSDLFRVPLVVHPSTFANASLIVLVAAFVSALIVRRRVDRLDLIRVLKTRE